MSSPEVVVQYGHFAFDELDGFAAGVGAVADAVFFLVRHLGEGLVRAVRDEKNVRPSPVYPTARELALIQNEVQWHIPGFEEILPPPMKLGPGGKKRRPRRRHHRPRPVQQQEKPGDLQPGREAGHEQ